MVNEISILERLITNLNQHGFERLVVVTGHLENRIRKFLGNRAGNLSIEYVYSPSYKTTNNIYSLWMAREIINEPFLLIESDLIFDPSLLTDMLYPDRIAVARMQSCLNGSTVTIDQFNKVEAFHNDAANHSSQTRYKTVNIYSLSLSSWYGVIEKLNQYVLAGKVNNYYEAVFGQMVVEKRLSFQAVFFDDQPWCEIDTIEDLASAERMFSSKYRESFPYHDKGMIHGILKKTFFQLMQGLLWCQFHTMVDRQKKQLEMISAFQPPFGQKLLRNSCLPYLPKHIDSVFRSPHTTKRGKDCIY